MRVRKLLLRMRFLRKGTVLRMHGRLGMLLRMCGRMKRVDVRVRLRMSATSRMRQTCFCCDDAMPAEHSRPRGCCDLRRTMIDRREHRLVRAGHVLMLNL